MIHSTFVPNALAGNLLTMLYAAYKGFALAEVPASRAAELLKELRAELGDSEYSDFESDVRLLLEKRNAWSAMSAIIAAAVKRKQALRSALGSRHRAIQSLHTGDLSTTDWRTQHGS
jgi:hypothetical protein